MADEVPSTGTMAYLICGTPRTGSTLLCELLGSTGVAGVPESYFRPPDEQSWADRWRLQRNADGAVDFREFVLAAVAAGTTGNGVFGARIMWGTMDELVARLAAAEPDIAGSDLARLTRAFGHTRFVHLRREDTVAQAVSWARAEQTHSWQDGDAASPEHPTFDFLQIDTFVRTIEDHNRAWREWFATFDIHPHEVRHEDLIADMGGVTREILDFLGIDLSAGWCPMPRSHRQADEINIGWTTRYRAAC